MQDQLDDRKWWEFEDGWLLINRGSAWLSTKIELDQSFIFELREDHVGDRWQKNLQINALVELRES